MGAEKEPDRPDRAPDTRPTLLLRVRDWGDQAAWQTFVEIYQPLIVGQCRKSGMQAADAEEICQEVLARVAESIRKFDYDPQRGRFRGWLYTVVRSRISAYFAGKPRQRSASDATLAAAPAAISEPDWEREYVDRLFDWACQRARGDVKPNTSFQATAVENRPVEVVAAELGMTAGAIYIARSRMIARIRELVREATDEELGL